MPAPRSNDTHDSSEIKLDGMIEAGDFDPDSMSAMTVGELLDANIQSTATGRRAAELLKRMRKHPSLAHSGAAAPSARLQSMLPHADVHYFKRIPVRVQESSEPLFSRRNLLIWLDKGRSQTRSVRARLAAVSAWLSAKARQSAQGYGTTLSVVITALVISGAWFYARLPDLATQTTEGAGGAPVLETTSSNLSPSGTIAYGTTELPIEAQNIISSQADGSVPAGTGDSRSSPAADSTDHHETYAGSASENSQPSHDESTGSSSATGSDSEPSGNPDGSSASDGSTDSGTGGSITDIIRSVPGLLL